MVWTPGPEFDRSEEAMALRFAQLRWGDQDGIPKCPDCGGTLWRLACRARVFGCSACNQQRSVTAGTLLHGAKIKLWQIWAFLVNLLQARRPSARALGRALGLHSETAWRWRHRLLLALTSRPATLEGRLYAAARRIPIRRPTRRSRPLPSDVTRAFRHHCAVRRYACVSLVGCKGGRWVAQVGYELARNLGDAIGRQPAIIPGWHTDETRALLDDIDEHVRHVFHGVSARWLERYAQFAVKRAWKAWSPEALCRRLFTLPPAVFDRLRPGTCPTVDDLGATDIHRPYCYLRPGYPQADFLEDLTVRV